MIGRAIVMDIQKKGGTALNLDIEVKESPQHGSIHCDITSDASRKLAVNTAIEHFGRIDGLVNNAYPRTKDWGGAFEEMKMESLLANVDWQMNSYIMLCQAVIKYMKQQGQGAIVNIASTYGVVGNDWTVYEGTNIVSPPAYSAIKGGIISFTRYLAGLYGKDGIRVNCVSPGGIFDHQPEPFVKAYEKKTPLKRMGKPEDIAPAVSFLLSDEASYITGHNLMVDGGWTAI